MIRIVSWYLYRNTYHIAPYPYRDIPTLHRNWEKSFLPPQKGSKRFCWEACRMYFKMSSTKWQPFFQVSMYQMKIIWGLNKNISDILLSLIDNWPNLQIPGCTCSISHNVTFKTEVCTFLFWMLHCGIWNRCILGFVKLVYSSILTTSLGCICRIMPSVRALRARGRLRVISPLSLTFCKRTSSTPLEHIRCKNNNKKHCQTSGICHTRSQHFNVSRLVLQLSFPHPLKPGVKSRMKM